MYSDEYYEILEKVDEIIKKNKEANASCSSQSKL